MAHREVALKYGTNDEGEKIIPSSLRADGSTRPERRIRDGYVPQDEKPVYKSQDALMKRGYQLCPGANFIEEKKTGLSKSAKKRQKKKEKSQEQKSQSTQTPVESLSNPGDPILPQVPEMDATIATAAQSTPEQKQIRALHKKLRQCEALLKRQEEGDTLTVPELEKISKRPGWFMELAHLEKTAPSESTLK